MPSSTTKRAAKCGIEESKACKKYNCLREKRHWLWAKYRSAEVDKRIYKPTEAQKAKTKQTVAARRAKDPDAFKANAAKRMAAHRNRRILGECEDSVAPRIAPLTDNSCVCHPVIHVEKVESDKAAALASLAAKYKADSTRVTKRKRRQSELATQGQGEAN